MKKEELVEQKLNNDIYIAEENLFFAFNTLQRRDNALKTFDKDSKEMTLFYLLGRDNASIFFEMMKDRFKESLNELGEDEYKEYIEGVKNTVLINKDKLDLDPNDIDAQMEIDKGLLVLEVVSNREESCDCNCPVKCEDCKC